jgi:hypothetical protein
VRSTLPDDPPVSATSLSAHDATEIKKAVASALREARARLK